MTQQFSPPKTRQSNLSRKKEVINVPAVHVYTLLHVPAKQINNCGAHLRTKGTDIKLRSTSFNRVGKHVQPVEFNYAEQCRKEMLEPFAQGLTFRFYFQNNVVLGDFKMRQ